MIKSLTLQNFQKHSNLKIDFTEGLNVIVGQSDVGKSAIIRALRWVTFNRPLGIEFKKFGTDFVNVRLNIDDIVLERYKDKKDNFYKLGEEYFRAFGNDIPDTINKLLNLKEINFQFQFDSPFLVSLTPSQINDYINSLVDLEDINNCLDKVGKEIRSTTNNIKNTESSIKQLKEKYKQYQDLSKYYKLYEDLEKEYKGLEKEKEVCDNVLQLLDRYEKLNEKIAKYKHIDNVLDTIEGIEKEYKELQDQLKQMDIISEKLSLYQNKLGKIENFRVQLKDLDKTFNDLIKEFGGVCPLCGNTLNKEGCINE